jgi:predicted enzyme related to lactoylglutathione lyase
MLVHYLEVVTKEVDALCELYSATQSVTFGDADPSLGGARTAPLKEGGMLGIRAPMHESEKPVTRAYLLVEDIEAAVAAAAKSGAKVALPPMKIPGHGTCAILIQGGIESGLWQL